jgi:hypothetical protein
LVPLKYGSRHEAGAAADQVEVAGRGELVAAGGGATVLPDDGARVRRSGAAVPGHHRLALVGDADGRHLVTTDSLDHLAERGDGCVPDLGGVVFDVAGLGIVLGELTIRRHRIAPVGEDGTTAHPGGAGVDGDHARCWNRCFAHGWPP